jgi:predicted nuclease of predicted toxin-antitoxin system
LKLLFDANLSPKLPRRLAELFPDSTHVFDTGLAQLTSDEAIWAYARDNGFVIVTADADFLSLARDQGSPPHVVLLENCNYRTARVEELLRTHAVRIAELTNSWRAVLVIRNTSRPHGNPRLQFVVLQFVA